MATAVAVRFLTKRLAHCAIEKRTHDARGAVYIFPNHWLLSATIALLNLAQPDQPIMFHFLAKLGRKPWAKNATNIVASSIPISYLATHIYAHQIVRNLFIAEDGHGHKAGISENLQSLILAVTQDIKDVFNKSFLPDSLNRGYVAKPPPIKWFSSSTLMPTTFGLTASGEGVIIGIPNYLNYDSPEEFPDNMFFFKKVKLLKSKTEETNETSEGTLPDKPNSGISDSAKKEIAETILRLDRKDPEVVKYIDTLLLSEKAKKFVIARELFMADSFRVLFNTIIITTSCAISLAIGRFGIKYLKVLDAHVSQRILVYICGGLAGQLHYNFFSDSSNREATLEADKKAATVNADYWEGAVEYFEKTIERNKALRDLVDEFQKIYDENGNVKQPYLRHKFVPLNERLKLVRREKFSLSPS